MKLEGRNLSLNLQGEDIKVFHSELRQLGFFIPDEELGKQFFGKGTHQAVLDFQEKHGLKGTGVVDEATAKQINIEVDALAQQKPVGNKSVDEAGPFIVR